jgi:hypothetical protein
MMCAMQEKHVVEIRRIPILVVLQDWPVAVAHAAVSVKSARMEPVLLRLEADVKCQIRSASIPVGLNGKFVVKYFLKV